MTAEEVKHELEQLADPEKAAFFPKFFKTGPGQYGEHDRFIGATVPLQRKVAKKYQSIALDEVKKLLVSPVHEHRLTGALILVGQYEKTASDQDELFNFYLHILYEHTTKQSAPNYTVEAKAKQRSGIDTWDIVDSSAHKIVGRHLVDKPRDLLYELAGSTELWQNRVALVSTLTLSKMGDTSDIFKLSEMMLGHPHDLIHKAAGWMMREAGKVNQSELERFLDNHAHVMPRTMLRYAIEKFPKEQRHDNSSRRNDTCFSDLERSNSHRRTQD